jgi:hypothetical protein
MLENFPTILLRKSYPIDSERAAVLGVAPHAQAAQRDARQEARGAIGQGPGGAGSHDEPMMLSRAATPSRFPHLAAGVGEPPIAPRLPLDFVPYPFLAQGHDLFSARRAPKPVTKPRNRRHTG